MLKLRLLIILMIVPCTVLKAQYLYPNDEGKRVNLRFSAGYSSEDLSWSIAGNSRGQNPNVYSELIWRDQRGPALAVTGSYRFFKSWFIEADYTTMKIKGGRVTDTDYGANNRTNPQFHVQLNSNRGSSSAGTLTIFNKLKITNKLNLLLGAGYGVKQQSLYLDDSDPNAQENLNSNYKTQWKGWLLCFNPVYQVSNKITLSGRFTYHQVTYAAKANWNLIPEFEHPLSFQHNAKGYGIQALGRLNFKLSSLITLQFNVMHGKWSTGKGTDLLYLLNGQRPFTQLNGVSSITNSILAGLEIKF